MVGPPLALDDLPLPRRIAVARALIDALATERDLAQVYAVFATRTPLAPLTAAFGELAQAKAAHVAMLEGLIGSVAAPPPRAPLDPWLAERADVFAHAFQAERALELGYRELAALTGGEASIPGLRQLIADAARHRDLVRHLYVRYS